MIYQELSEINGNFFDGNKIQGSIGGFFSQLIIVLSASTQLKDETQKKNAESFIRRDCILQFLVFYLNQKLKADSVPFIYGNGVETFFKNEGKDTTDPSTLDQNELNTLRIFLNKPENMGDPILAELR